jgi:hypothetical protein
MIGAMHKLAVFKHPAPRASVIDVNYVVIVFFVLFLLWLT